jgi:competence protein ComFC
LVSLFRYGPETKKIIRGLKQDLIKDSVDCLASFLAEEIKNLYVFKSWKRQKYIFTPVPLHKTREKWRGFNQSAVLLKQICQKLEVEFRNDLIVRIKPTKDQTKLKADKRVKNMENAFMIEKKTGDCIKEKNFLIFDDVKTTGATLEECGKILKSSGARFVWGLALAE